MTDDWLRDALEDAVSDVEPREALDSIRSRTKVTPMSSKRPWIYGATGAVLATAATITAFALVDTGGTPDSANDPGVATNPPSATDQPLPTDSGSPDPVGESVEVPVYYVGEVSFPSEGGGPQTAFRLYREWHAADGSGTPAEVAAAAVDRMFDAPEDPDYSTPWSGDVSVREVTHADGVVTVDLTGPVQQAQVGAETAELAVQQLVYTVQGALAVMDDTSATDPVRILVDGEAAGDLWGHVDASQPIARAEKTGTQASIWITAPYEGATVGTSFTVTGIAQVFEATVSWRVLQNGTEVAKGFTTAAEGAPAFSEYSFEVKGLQPGEYVLEVFESSALDGSPTFIDSKNLTVE